MRHSRCGAVADLGRTLDFVSADSRCRLEGSGVQNELLRNRAGTNTESERNFTELISKRWRGLSNETRIVLACSDEGDLRSRKT
jgi:hypothetical protein